MRGLVMAAVLIAGCGTPRRAIISGSVAIGVGGLMVGHAAATQDAEWGSNAARNRDLELLAGVPLIIGGTIVLVSGIAAAIANRR